MTFHDGRNKFCGTSETTKRNRRSGIVFCIINLVTTTRTMRKTPGLRRRERVNTTKKGKKMLKENMLAKAKLLTRNRNNNSDNRNFGNSQIDLKGSCNRWEMNKRDKCKFSS